MSLFSLIVDSTEEAWNDAEKWETLVDMIEGGVTVPEHLASLQDNFIRNCCYQTRLDDARRSKEFFHGRWAGLHKLCLTASAYMR